MSTLLISHPAFADHLVPPGHPERPERMRAVEQALEAEAFQSLIREEAPLAAVEVAKLAHPARFVDELERSRPREGMVRIDGDTVMSPGTWEALLRALGGVLEGRAKNAFCAQRPPGHHAEAEIAMGFCLFNFAVVAAKHAQKKHGAERVAIVDFDVHHGNGSEAIFRDDPRVLLCSSFRHPFYPYSGSVPHAGFVAAPLPAGADGKTFRAVVERDFLPALDAFRPELVCISAGFDAHRDDPLGGLTLVDADYAWITRQLCALADRHAAGRVVSVLEGGYDPGALGRCAVAHVGEMR